MVIVFIGLGANCPAMGRAPAGLLAAAAEAVGALVTGGVCSPLYRSPAWPDPAGPPYVNAVLRGQTGLAPAALLAGLLAIEAAFGRVRAADPALRYAPRPLDLDLLDHGGAVLAAPGLDLPHPRLALRDFVLRPLRDVAPDWRHPVSGATPDALLAALGPVTPASAHRLPHTGEGPMGGGLSTAAIPSNPSAPQA